MKDLFTFIFQLIWFIIRNLVCYPFAAIACAWEDSWNHYSFHRRMKRESQKQRDERQYRHNGDNHNLPPPKFKGPGSGPHYFKDDYHHHKRKRRGHRGGRKHHKKG